MFVLPVADRRVDVGHLRLVEVESNLDMLRMPSSLCLGLYWSTVTSVDLQDPFCAALFDPENCEMLASSKFDRLSSLD